MWSHTAGSSTAQVHNWASVNLKYCVEHYMEATLKQQVSTTLYKCHKVNLP